jgi:hypothetical protein
MIRDRLPPRQTSTPAHPAAAPRASAPHPILVQRAVRGQPLLPAEVMALQRTLGNRAVGGLLSGPRTASLQRVIYNGKTTRAQPFSSIKGSGLYRNRSGAVQALVLALHESEHDYFKPEVLEIIGRPVLPTLKSLEDEKAKQANEAKAKPNAAAKGRQKAKSREMRGIGKGRRIKFNSKKWTRANPRVITEKHLVRGARLTGLSVTLVEKLAKKNSVLKAILAHAKAAERGALDRHQSLVEARTVTTNLNGRTVSGLNEYLASTHVTLRGTDNRSSYGAFARPDAGQAQGVLHPLLNPGDVSQRVLNGVEVLRNDGRFALSMVLKSAALQDDAITIKQAVNPRKYGTHEISEVSGQSRDEYEAAVDANTDFLYEERVESEDPLAEMLATLMEEEDDGEDTTATMQQVEAEFAARIREIVGGK